MTDQEFTWDSEIQEESEFIVLPTGEYDFTVINFERDYYEPGEKSKIPACPMAKLKLKIMYEGKEVIIVDRLYITKKMEGMLGSFFRCLGFKKKNEPVKMVWDKVPGATGRAKINKKIYNGNESNNVKQYLPKDEVSGTTTTSSAPAGGGADPWA